VRPGGEFEYEITATNPGLRRGMDAAGMALTSVGHGKYAEVVLHRRIAYVTIVDFVLDTESYEVATAVEFRKKGSRVEMVLLTDAMYNEEWTKMAVTGFNGQLDRFERLLTGERSRKPWS
jgi:hypothetical protein